MACLISVNSQTAWYLLGVPDICSTGLTASDTQAQPFLYCLLLLQQESLLTPHTPSSSCRLMHPDTLSHSLAELRLLAHFRVCAVPGIWYVSDVSPRGDALKSWSLVWNGRVGASERQGLSGCYWVTDSPQELTLPSSQKGC